MIAPRRSTKRLYLDSSALVKLVVPEAESGALRGLLGAWPRRFSSALAAVEVVRAARLYSSAPALMRRASQLLARLVLIDVTADVLAHAASAEPATLRSLDTIHLASALSLGRDLGGFVTYDEHLAEAARAAGIPVLAPR